MHYHIRIKPRVEKELANLPRKEYHRMLAAFMALARDPFVGKKLEGKYAGFWSYRVWPYRIIYTIIKSQITVIVVRIGHRQGVYGG